MIPPPTTSDCNPEMPMIPLEISSTMQARHDRRWRRHPRAAEVDWANPQSNEKLARVAAKVIASGSKAGGRGDPVAELKAFIIRAAADTGIKASLKNDIVSHSKPPA